jgi:molybdopterin/thiamine biosynthesis adenylyltransferase
VILDALDNAKTRLLLEKTADALRIPLVHGAVEGWCAQVCTVFPGDFILSMLYSHTLHGPAAGEFDGQQNFPKPPSVLSFAPAFCASLQASEAVKVLLNRENTLRRKLLTVDMQNCCYEIIDL